MPVEVGDLAPDFTLPDQNNQPVSLSSFKGEKSVLVVFYPLAFSGVCSGELCALRDDLPRFQSESVQVLTISVDSFFVHRVWADQEKFDFPLLSDFWPHGAVAAAFGVFDERRGCADRSTFIVDKQGVLRWSVHNAMPDARDLQEQAKVLAEVA